MSIDPPQDTASWPMRKTEQTLWRAIREMLSLGAGPKPKIHPHNDNHSDSEPEPEREPEPDSDSDSEPVLGEQGGPDDAPGVTFPRLAPGTTAAPMPLETGNPQEIPPPGQSKSAAPEAKPHRGSRPPAWGTLMAPLEAILTSRFTPTHPPQRTLSIEDRIARSFPRLYTGDDHSREPGANATSKGDPAEPDHEPPEPGSPAWPTHPRWPHPPLRPKTPQGNGTAHPNGLPSGPRQTTHSDPAGERFTTAAETLERASEDLRRAADALRQASTCQPPSATIPMTRATPGGGRAVVPR